MSQSPPAIPAFQTGYAPVNGIEMYYEIYGAPRPQKLPLLLLHGGLGLGAMFAPILPQLAQDRQVITVDLYAHGHTAAGERALRAETLADDVAALLHHLELEQVHLLGYSMGGVVALRTAIQFPESVGRLVLVSTPFRHDGWLPEIVKQMRQMGAAAAPFLKGTPIYESYIQTAPRPEDFPILLDKMGEMIRQNYNWADEIAELKLPVLLVYGDADSVPPVHAVEFFALLGGGLRDGGWDGTGLSNAQLAILPGLTHYNVFVSPELVATVIPFLDGAATPNPSA